MTRTKIVRNSDEHVSEFDRNKIAESVYEEINYVAKELGLPQQITKEEAHFIALKVEKQINRLDFKFLSGPSIRELVNVNLSKFDQDRGNSECTLRRFYTRVGLPVAEALMIDRATSDSLVQNSSQVINAETMHKKKADAMSKEEMLLLLPHKLADGHLRGDYHIHDSSYFTTRTFCMDHDLRFWLYYGLDPDCTGKTNIAGPAMNAEVAILHATKVLGSAQTNFAGGQGYYNFLTFLAPYFKGKTYEEIKQLMQMFIFEIAQTMVARGSQVVFSSIQLSPGVPKIWKDKFAVYKGKIWNGENGEEPQYYGDFEPQVRLAFRAIMEVMLKGDVWGKPFNFPKPEIAIEQEFLISHEEDIYYERRNLYEEKLKEFYPEYERRIILQEQRQVPSTYSELYDSVFELTAAFGTPYFDNMIPEYRKKGDGIACYQCCAYSFTAESDSKNFQEKLNFVNGQHFSMGGAQVITPNFPRIAYRAEKNNFEDLMKETKIILDKVIKLMLIKRDWTNRAWDNGLMPFASQRMIHPETKEVSPYLVDLDELVYIIGDIGMNEVAEIHTGYPIYTKDGKNFVIKYLNYVKSYINERAKKYDIKLVLARTPAEETGQRFAVSDLRTFPESKNFIKGDVKEAMRNLGKTSNLPIYYTNGTHVPVEIGEEILTKIDTEGIFFGVLDGGNIFHIWLGEHGPDAKGLKEFAWKLIKNTDIGYFTFTKDFTICNDCKTKADGLLDVCISCASENVVGMSRITGYIQVVSGWNSAKKQELKDRVRLTKLQYQPNV